MKYKYLYRDLRTAGDDGEVDGDEMLWHESESENGTPLAVGLRWLRSQRPTTSLCLPDYRRKPGAAYKYSSESTSHISFAQTNSKFFEEYVLLSLRREIEMALSIFLSSYSLKG